MGDVFMRGLSPAKSSPPTTVYGDRFEIFAYQLPDDGWLARHLDSAGPQQFPECDVYFSRLQEAIDAWNSVVPRSTLIVLRYVIGATVEDYEVTESLTNRANWLA